MVKLTSHVERDTSKVSKEFAIAAEQFGQALAWLGEGVILRYVCLCDSKQGNRYVRLVEVQSTSISSCHCT